MQLEWVCVCAILFRDLQCVVAFSDNYRRLLKYRLGLISGRLLGGPEERRRWYLPRLERAWSWFVAIHVENTISSHNFTRERAAPRTAPSTPPSTTPCRVPRTTPRPARSTGFSSAASPTPDTATNTAPSRYVAGSGGPGADPSPVTREIPAPSLVQILVHLPVRLLS